MYQKLVWSYSTAPRVHRGKRRNTASKPSTPQPESGSRQAAEHVAGAHRLLKALQDKVGEHPEIGQAIHKLETALAILEVQTGEML
jgi:hypothetical protein